MRTVMLICFTPFFLLTANAQLIKRKVEEAKTKTSQRVDTRSSEGIDKGLDKVEDEIKKVFKKKGKKNTGDTVQQAPSMQDADISINGANGNNRTSYSTNKKFDFEPGSQQLYFDNFERVAIGDFPAEYNTNASGEVKTVNGKQGKWLALTKNGAFIPESIKSLPDNFTLEFEAGILGDPTNNYSGFGLNFTTNPDELMKDMFFGKGTSILFLHPGASQATISIIPTVGNEINNELPMNEWTSDGKNFAKVSIWRQKGRLRVYVNEDKILDAPRFFSENTAYQLSFFRSFFNDCELLLTNIRFAVAGADTRSKLITEGRFVTTAIQFDVNSDNIKPESGAVLKEIAGVLSENPQVRIKIIGHTDNDGADAANLLLSQKRALAVKNALAAFYSTDPSRIETDGKGETQPLNGNKTATEKAQNRRVEFIKL